MRTFHVTGSTVYLDGRVVATLNPSMNVTLRDDVTSFLHGRRIDCCEQTADETWRECENSIVSEAASAAEAEWYKGYEAGLMDGRDGTERARP